MNQIIYLVVTIDGIIPESVKVWKISPSATADDYHNNIGEAQFDRYMNDLEVILENLGGKWIIVIVSTVIAFENKQFCRPK